MIIEIGTSDFDTMAGIQDGIFIEPVKYYYNRLPDCKKENIAISNYDGYTDIYYVEYDNIIKYNLPDWIRGCSSINKHHPTVVDTLTKYNLPLSIINKDKISVHRLQYIIDKYRIKDIDLLKIDTEGHDAYIILDYMHQPPILPKTIIFENNILSDPSMVEQSIQLLIKHRYNITHIENNIIGKLL